MASGMGAPRGQAAHCNRGAGHCRPNSGPRYNHLQLLDLHEFMRLGKPLRRMTIPSDTNGLKISPTPFEPISNRI
jgi:hypothetical protein